MFIEKPLQVIFTYLPVMIMMTFVLPKNLEMASFQFYESILTLYMVWGQNLVGAMLAGLWGNSIRDEDFTYTYSELLTIRVPLVLTIILVVNLIPFNKRFRFLQYRLTHKSMINAKF